MSEWEKEKLEDVCTKVTDGTHDSPKSVISGGYPLIKGKDISSGFIDFNNCEYISEEDHLDVLKRSKTERGDILFSNVGSVGDCVFVSTDREFSIKNVALFKPNSKVIVPKFLYYIVSGKQFQGEIKNRISGSAQQFASLTLLRKHKVILPPLPTQQKIAKILSNYDDLIENNLKRIKLLEESARVTYEEWFLRFRIDGEKLEIDSKIGLPFGWEKKKLISLCENFTDGTHDSPKAFDGENAYYLITGKHLANNEIDFSTPYKISKDDHNKIMKRSGVQNLDVLFSNIGTLGQVAMVNEFIDFSCKNVFIFRALENIECFLFEFLKYEPNKENFIAQSSGSTQKFISLQYMRQFKTVIAPNNFLYKFNENIKPIYNEIDNLRKQNQLLKEARDILLPRLMIGIIDTEDMEIAV